MVGTVTLGIDRYNALYKRAIQADALEKENAELREKLNGTTDVSYEMVDGSVLRGDTNKVTLDATEVYQVIREALDKVKEEELHKVQKVDLPDEVEFHDTPYGKVVVINGKQIKLKNGNIQLCNNSTKFYATGGLTTKSELTELKRSKKNQRRRI